LKNYPINLDLNKKKVLLVGGGKVALRKFKRLMKTGAFVKIVSPKLKNNFSIYLEKKNIINKYRYFKRKFHENDLNDIWLVIAATDNKKINTRIAKLAKEKKLLTNIVDDKDSSNFTLPSVVNRGDFMLTFSTNGKLPALSRKLRIEFEEKFGDEYELYLEEIGKIRKKIIDEIDDIEKRKYIFRNLANRDFIENFSDNTEDVFSYIDNILNKERKGDYCEKENSDWNQTKSTCCKTNKNCS